MPKVSQPKLLKRIKISTPEQIRWRWGSALFDSKGRIRRDHVRVGGRDEVHPEGSYYLEWWDDGKRYREPVGPNAFVGAEKMRLKQAELTAVRNGIIPAPPVVEADPERKTLAQALDSYKEYVQYHRSRRTFRTYRPILDSFKQHCKKTYVDDVERQDLVDFATYCMKQGQRAKVSTTNWL